MRQRRQPTLPQVNLYREHQPQSQFGAAFGVIAPGMRRQEVFALEVKPREPRALLSPEKLRFRFLRERHVELEMAVTRRLALGRIVQPVLCILAHSFQHRVPCRASLDPVGCDE